MKLIVGTCLGLAVAAALFAGASAHGDAKPTRTMPAESGSLIAVVREGSEGGCVNTGPGGSPAFRFVVPPFSPNCPPTTCASTTSKATSCPKPRPDGIYIVDENGLDPHWLAAGVEPAWSADGTTLSYSTGRFLAIQGVDGKPERDVIVALPTALADAGGEIGASSWSPDGSRIVFSVYYTDAALTGMEWREDLYAVDMFNLDIHQLTANAANDSDHAPAYSPDGSEIAYAHWGAQPGIWLLDADATHAREIRAVSGYPYSLAWSPDGRRIVFAVFNPLTVTSEIDIVNADGSGLLSVPATDQGELPDRPVWSADGSEIEFTNYNNAGSRVLYAVRPDGTGLHPVLREPWDVYQPAWQPG